MEKRLLTIPEAAHLLGIGRSLTYSLVMSGQLVSIKLGRSRRVPDFAIGEFVTQKLEEQGEGVKKKAS